VAEIILEMNNITKTFPGVKALDNVNLRVEKGEIHALVGENGAGKSTLMNVLSGIYPYGTYEGDIVYKGEVCKFHNIKDSEGKGIVIIHQELALVPEMTIGEKHVPWQRARQQGPNQLGRDLRRSRQVFKDGRPDGELPRAD